MPSSGDGPRAFKELFERSLAQAGLSTRGLAKAVRGVADLPETTIESWLRPHATTGRSVLPSDEARLQPMVAWLCGLARVTVTEEELMAAWRSDRAAQAASRRNGPGRNNGPGPDPAAVRLQRGQVYEGIIDASIYLHMDHLLGGVDDRLRELLNAGQPIPTYFAYLTHRGYFNWVRLTEDHRYGYYRAGVELCEANAEKLAGRILAAAGQPSIDLVALGPGTGAKDRALLSSLLTAGAAVNDAIYYYPYDVNPAMIVHAIGTVLGGHSEAEIRVKGIIAPFDLLGLFSYVYKDRSAPNVLSLLGNTLGNMGDDCEFLETVFTSGMWPGDLFLLEVRCHVDAAAGQAPGIGEDAKKRFNFGPLEILGASYDDHRDLITIRRERSRSAVPDTITTVTRCERVRCGDRAWADVRLAYVHEYSEPALDAVIGDIGFTVVEKYHRGVSGADAERVVLLYLLQKP